MGLTTKQAADILGVTTRAIVKLCQQGKLKADMHGRDWDIEPESVRQYSENRPKPGPKTKAQ